MDLYIASDLERTRRVRDQDASRSAPALAEADLWRVWDILMDAFKEDTTSYLEAKTWLITSVSNLPHVPAKVRLEALAPYLRFAATQRSAAAAGLKTEDPRGVARKEGRGRQRGRSRSRSHSRSGSGGCGSRGEQRGRAAQRSRSRSSSRGRSRSRSCGRSRSKSHSKSGSRRRGGSRGLVEPSRSNPAAQLTGSSPESLIVHQLLLLLLEQRGLEVARLLARRPSLFRNFFAGSDLRVMMWFRHFSMSGMTGFKYGAFALAHYALAHRDEAWQYLVWEGKHAQAPVSVATKTHYFCEINVLATVRNFVEYCPSFWSSDQLLKTFTQTGEILQLDPPYFVKVLHGILCEDPQSSDGLPTRAHNLLSDFVSQESWQLLSHRLLSLMGDEELLELVSTVSMAASLKPVRGVETPASAAPGAAVIQSELQHLGGAQGWQDLQGITLSGGPHWVSLPHLVLTHALASHRGQLHGMLHAEEDAHAKLEEVEAIALRLHGFASRSGKPLCRYQAPSQEHWHLFATLRPPEQSASSRQLLALEAWTLRLALSHASQLPAATARTAGSRPPSSAMPLEVSLLEVTVHHLGGTCRALHTAAPSRAFSAQPMAALSGSGGMRVYDMLPSSSSSSEEESDEAEAPQRRRRKHGKGDAHDGGYALLSSSEEDKEHKSMRLDKKARRKSKKGKKKKRHKKGKKGSKETKKRKRHEQSSSEKDTSESSSIDDYGKAAPDKPPSIGSSPQSMQSSDQEGLRAAGCSSGVPQLHATALYELELPTASTSTGSHCVQLSSANIHATGTATDVADLLACIALKHWLQAALLVCS